jgi:prepilin-type processing-associated H-X9-DG protein
MKRPNRRFAGFGLADLVVVAVLIPVCGVGFLGCRRHRGDGAVRVKCAANLKTIGQALLLYSNDNRGSYPRTAYEKGPVVTPTWGTAEPAPNDVSAALYLLSITQDFSQDVFLCPSSAQEKWDFEKKSPTDFRNWPGRDAVRMHLSYSYQNPYPDDAAVRAGFELKVGISSEFAVAADMNPGMSGDSSLLSVKVGDGQDIQRRANSLNHERDGQNVLYGDGHVEFQTSPFAGVGRDNIFTRKRTMPAGEGDVDLLSDAVIPFGSPLNKDDSILLPTDD